MDYATANTLRLAAYRKRTADVYAADPKGWGFRVAKGERYLAWLREVPLRCAWLKPQAKVVPIEAARAKRRAR